ncbi:MAG: SWIM zinc finger family protein [Bacteroidota bacterium]
MNFPIKNIESQFEDDLIQKAEMLLFEGLVRDVSGMGKNLWIQKVFDTWEDLQRDTPFEVEVQLTGKKVKAFTCECDFFQQNQSTKLPCKHIVAALLHLRKYLLQKELEKEKSRVRPTNKPTKLTTATVLNSVNLEALKNFVRSYARTDKKFSIALKARFAHTVQLDNPKEKYIQLLQSTFNSVKNTKDKINYHAVQQITSVIKDILEHVDDAIALDHYAEANSILQAIILKLAPNIKRAENHEEKMVSLMELGFAGMAQLVKKELAPELKKEIWAFSLENFDGKEHKKYGTQHYFFKLLLALTAEKKEADLLIEKLDTQLEFVFDKKKKGELLLVKMKLLEQFYAKDLSDFISENMEESEILIAAIKNAIQQDNYKDARQLALRGLDIQKSVRTRNQLDDFLLNIALKTDDRKNIVTYARKRFLVTFEFHFYHILKNASEENWEKDVEVLLEEIKKQPYTPNKKETFAAIYAEEKMYGRLVNYIRKIRSLDLLEKYDLELLENYKKEVFDLYEDFLDGYLRNHLGRQTSVKIRDIFYKLKKIGAQSLVNKLAKQYRQQYPERHTLMEELAFF